MGDLDGRFFSEDHQGPIMGKEVVVSEPSEDVDIKFTCRHIDVVVMVRAGPHWVKNVATWLLDQHFGLVFVLQAGAVILLEVVRIGGQGNPLGLITENLESVDVVLGGVLEEHLLPVDWLVIAEESKARPVQVGDISAEVSVLHVLDVVVEGHEVFPIIVGGVVGLPAEVIRPELTLIRPVSVKVLDAPGIPDADESVSLANGIGHLEGAHDGEGVVVGEADLVSVLVTQRGSAVATGRDHGTLLVLFDHGCPEPVTAAEGSNIFVVPLVKGRSNRGLNSVGAEASVYGLVITQVLREDLLVDSPPEGVVFADFGVQGLDHAGPVLGQWQKVVDRDCDGKTKHVHVCSVGACSVLLIDEHDVFDALGVLSDRHRGDMQPAVAEAALYGIVGLDIP